MVSNNPILVENAEELKEYVLSSGKRYELWPKILHRWNPAKERRRGIYLSSNEWQNNIGMKYRIVYPSEDVKNKLESIPITEVEALPCAEIHKTRNIPLYLIIEYKSLLLNMSEWTKSGHIHIPNPNINFKALEMNCTKLCQEWKNGLVNCIPNTGFY